MLAARALLRKRAHAAAPSSWPANNAVQPATLDVVNGGVKMYRRAGDPKCRRPLEAAHCLDRRDGPVCDPVRRSLSGFSALRPESDKPMAPLTDNRTSRNLGTMAMLRFVSLILTATVLSSACFAQDTPRLPRLPLNVSSHSAGFLESLLAGRVWVFNWHGAPSAIHFTRGHRAVGCWTARSGNSFVRTAPHFRYMEWRIGAPDNPTSLQFIADIPGGENPTYTMVVIYDPRTGRFHAEQFSRSTGKWHVNRDGWIQDRLPAALRPLCPPLSSSPDLPIDQRQNSLDWTDLKRAASSIRDFPGSEYSYIGATGLGASSGQPTMTPQQVEKLRTPHERRHRRYRRRQLRRQIRLRSDPRR